MDPTAPSPEAPAPWPQKPLRVRIPVAIIGVALIALVPIAIGIWLGHPKEALAAVYGAVITVSSAMTNGLRTTRLATPYYLLALVLGALTKPVPSDPDSALLGGWLWIALIVALAVASGLATQRGAGVAMSMATLYAVVVPPFAERENLMHAVVFLLVGSLYGALISLKLGATTGTTEPRTPPRVARVIALFLGLAAGIAAAAAVITAAPHGAWLVTAVVVLGIPTPGLTERLILLRMLGQLCACGLVFAVTVLITRMDPSNPMLWFGLAATLTAVCYVTVLGSNPAITIAFLSATILLPVAAHNYREIGGMVGGRLLDNLLGLGILAFALLGVRLWTREHPAGGTTTPAA